MIVPCHNHRHFIHSFGTTLRRTNAHLRDEGKTKTDCSVHKFLRTGRQRQKLLCAVSELIGACQIEEETNEQVIGWMWVSNTAEYTRLHSERLNEFSRTDCNLTRTIELERVEEGLQPPPGG